MSASPCPMFDNDNDDADDDDDNDNDNDTSILDIMSLLKASLLLFKVLNVI